MSSTNQNMPLRRLTTGRVVLPTQKIAKDATFNVDVVFDQPLPDDNYNVTVHAYDDSLSAFFHVSTIARSKTGCTIVLMNAGAKTSSSVTVEVIAARRIIG